jgi:DNA mismatch endonuclease (patch repair protein)
MAGLNESSWASSAGIRRSMQSNRGRDTALELRIRSALHREGLRFRKHVRPLPGLRCTADVVFPRERLAIFIDGCFWHSCPTHASYPKANRELWQAKLNATRERDNRNRTALKKAGWHVMQIWEHEDLTRTVTRVKTKLDRLRGRVDLR